MVALNAQTEKRWWLWTPKLRKDGGSKYQTKKRDGGSKHQIENMALKAKLRRDSGSECQTKKRWWLRKPN